ncbi:hypothetical protein L210DRAFT_985630 [Boletus edulis BED1]|uniref:Uncharacterized protein n=1 Tax=Boletus edulis BED1 TaxID=1328754 RepID=A0AAD4BGH1_BOLED|nr:hypothetical protein L210DRAFT_985630 [Boletus edulis BED1]
MSDLEEVIILVPGTPRSDYIIDYPCRSSLHPPSSSTEKPLASPARISGRSTSLNSLAVDLSIRYNKLSVMEDLDEAIVLGREALDLRPQKHPHRPTSMDNDLAT